MNVPVEPSRILIGDTIEQMGTLPEKCVQCCSGCSRYTVFPNFHGCSPPPEGGEGGLGGMMNQWSSQCGRAQLYCGDCLAVMPTLAAESVDAIVTDPPYGLSFMGKDWDRGVPGEHFWREAYRVAKPGAHLLAFGGTRTYHRQTSAIEDAGWEIRDCIMWVYGSGFPKSLDVSKAIDKAAGAEREVVGYSRGVSVEDDKGLGGIARGGVGIVQKAVDVPITAPATDAARKWSGWGTALKPAVEPIVLARKPLQGTVAANVLRHGTGAINVDGCRVGTEGGCKYEGGPGFDAGTINALGGHLNCVRSPAAVGLGRWPANLIHDGSDEVVDGFPQDGESSAARFFYCSKADGKDREHGNTHATVKPNDLMRYLCKLIAPKDAIILDPFMGSGSTGVAAIQMNNRFIGIELGEDHFEICKRRVAAAFDTFPLLNPKGNQ